MVRLRDQVGKSLLTRVSGGWSAQVKLHVLGIHGSKDAQGGFLLAAQLLEQADAGEVSPLNL